MAIQPKTITPAKLYFGGPYTRRLVTVPLNLQLAQYVEFNLYQAVSNSSNNVVFAYSSTNGNTWTQLSASSQQSLSSTASYTLALPSEARRSGVTLMWWQPNHGAGDQWVSSVHLFTANFYLGSRQCLDWASEPSAPVLCLFDFGHGFL